MSYDPITINNGINNTPSSKIADRFINGSGSTFAKGKVVRVDSSNELQVVDISVKQQVYSIFGAIDESLADGESGVVISKGRIQNVTTTSSVGDVIYLSKTSEISSIVPEVGSNGFLEGDFIVRVGFIIQNEANPLLKDLMVDIQIIAQL